MTPTPIPTHVLAVDPGVHGAICFLTVSTRRVQVWDMPLNPDGQVDPRALAASIDAALFVSSAQIKRVHGVVELVSSMPRQAGAFNFGRSTGVVHGVFGAMGIDYSLVFPSQWKGAMGLYKTSGETQEQNKTRARELASRLWPDLAASFRRVKDDGRAEACLLARYFSNRY